MNYRDYIYIIEDPAVERCLRYKTDNTRRLYRGVMKRFLAFTGEELSLEDPSGFVKLKSRPVNLEVQDLIEKLGVERDLPAG